MTKKSSLIFFGLLAMLANCSTNTERPIPENINDSNKAVSFKRSIAINTCDNKGKCSGPIIKDLSRSEVTLNLEEFSKGYVDGVTGQDLYSINEEGVLFRSEIRVVKKKDQDQYSIYMMIRSGPGLKRNGKTKTFYVNDFANLTEVSLLDDPIPYAKGTLQAKLIISPK